MSEVESFSPGKTMLRRMEQYRDRWTSYGATTGIVSISDKLSPAEMQQFEIFQGYDEKFLEKISPDVSVVVWEEGALLFEEGSYLDLAFFVVEGEVEVYLQRVGGVTEAQPIFDLERTGILKLDGPLTEGALPEPTAAPEAMTQLAVRTSQPSESEITFLASMDFNLPKGTAVRLGAGEIFGEIGALSGWPQSVTARVTRRSTLVQIRVPALRIMKRKSSALKERVDRLYRERSLASQLQATPMLRQCGSMFLDALAETVELVSCEPDEIIVREGDAADALFLVRSGFVRLLQRFGEGELTVSYLSKGMTLGEIELLAEGLDRWEVTAVSVEYSELVKIPRKAFENLLATYPGIEEQLWQSAATRIKEAGLSKRDIGHAEFTQVALETGLVQGTSMLVIDLNTCTRCDDCVRGCAATHGGRPRFVREGNKYDNLLIAKSCYHCRDPVCLVGCPTGAIHRAGVDDVVEIDDPICIGCSTCANACPYDAIVMHETGQVWPDDMVPVGLRGRDRQVASKCDLCHDSGHGPACVSNCPQGCAFRVGSLEEFRQLLAERK